MNIFQKIGEWIKGIPSWLKTFLDMVWDILWAVMQEVSKQAYEALKNKIIEVAGKNITNDQKFNEVWNFAKKDLMISIKDSALSLLIESLVSLLKRKGQI